MEGRPGIESGKSQVSLESVLSQLRNDYMSYTDIKTAEMVRDVMDRLEEMKDVQIDPDKAMEVKNMVTGNFAEKEPQQIAERITKYLNKEI